MSAGATPREAVVFEARGPYALFRKNYSPLSPVSFPTPPPTAIAGMVGAVLGLSKREYLAILGESTWKVGVRLLAPVRHYRAGLNLINTKDEPYLFTPAGANPHIQIPFEFLKDPAYRIFFAHADEALMGDLERRLRDGTPVYTPCLGLANCLAELKLVGRLPRVRRAVRSGGTVELTSVVPTGAVGPRVRYQVGRRYLRYVVPARMAPDRTVTAYQEVVHDSGDPVTGAVAAIEAEVAEYEECGVDRVVFY
ncbi:MAG: type I-B CRISPR-associated protein Cas5 [Planctomycetes bacterium]|nr:type I-B CRISPR-associated protein Cas5 [Planctomycetota bacterium]